MSYMSNKITEKLSRNAFWLSILLHILFVLFILIALLTKPEQEKKEADPILLIGDDSHPADPLIKLLGRSLSAHFRYPRMAGQLGITGRVVISLTLHPEGYYSDVQMMQSSDSQELDAAALYAVNS